jgi:hypothetical protein
MPNDPMNISAVHSGLDMLYTGLVHPQICVRRGDRQFSIPATDPTLYKLLVRELLSVFSPESAPIGLDLYKDAVVACVSVTPCRIYPSAANEMKSSSRKQKSSPYSQMSIEITTC